MTKLSHIPMQIQKWIASLAHLFFLILGLTGICLMYIHGNLYFRFRSGADRHWLGSL